MKRARYGYIGIAILFLTSLAAGYAVFLPRADAYHMGMDANQVIGQANFIDSLANNANPDEGFGNPRVDTDGTRLFVSDCSGNRVLIYNTIPTSSSATPDIVVGQADFTSTNANQGGSVAANTLHCPVATQVADGKLLIADASNRRVLVFNSIPTSNNTSANVVIGQADMTANEWVTAADNFRNATDIAYDSVSGKLLISSSSDHRVLVYNTIPTTNGVAADVVIGQTSFTANSQNQGGSVAANTLRFPAGLAIDGSKLLVADNWNNRVLVFNTIPIANDASADVVIGQANMTSAAANNGGISATTLSNPQHVTLEGSNLLVADSSNNRVLVYSGVPIANGAAATAAIGQPDFTSNSYGVSSQRLRAPTRVASTSGRIFVGDTTNNRIVSFTSLSTDATADIVLGQPDFASSLPFAATVDGSHFYDPQGVATDGTRLFVADSRNNRVLIWNSIPSSPSQPADVVVGQPDMTSTAANQGGSPAANTLSRPQGVMSDGTRLFVADSSNSRALIWNSIPSANNQPADIVVGQPDMTTATWNTTQAQFGWVTGVFYDAMSGKLVVTDSDNNRVMLYNTVPTTNGAAADVVVGQPNFTSSNYCTWQAATASCLSQNYGTSQIMDGKLVVPDNVDNRVLIWNTVPTTNGAAADVVVGQPDFTSTNYGGYDVTMSGSTLARPNGVAYDGKRFFINDGDSCRILVYDHIPTTNGEEADFVIGLNDKETVSCGQPASRSTIMSAEFGSPLSSIDGKLMVADSTRNRVLVFTNPLPVGLSLQVPSLTTDNTPTISWTFGDGDPDDIQTRYRVQIDTSTGFSSSNLRDTNWVTSTASQYTVPTSLADGQWYVRLRLTDSQNDDGNWSSARAMAIDTAKATPPPITSGQNTTTPDQTATEEPATPESTITLRQVLVDSKTVNSANEGELVYVGTNRPTFEGVAEPLSTVTITIEGIGEFSVTASSNGRWSFTPDADIANGSYRTTIVSVDEDGNESEPVAFVLGVNTMNEAAATAETDEEGADEAGVNWMTGAGLVLFALFVAGVLWLLIARRRKSDYEQPLTIDETQAPPRF